MATSDPEYAWVAEATAKIGDWRATMRSVYLRWAITINACFVAEEHYKKLPPENALMVKSLRFENGVLQDAEIARWRSPEAAAQYAVTIPTIASHAIVELYAALEETIFELYEIVLRHKPEQMLKGDANKALRRLWQKRSQGDAAEAAWQAAWSQRFEQWQRKRLYDGLAKVFLALFKTAGLRRPSTYSLTDEYSWAKHIEMIAELRNHIVHGAAVVSDKLANLSGGLFRSFVAGAPLEVHTYHLQSVECFCDQLLTALNLSLVEILMPLKRDEAQSE